MDDLLSRVFGVAIAVVLLGGSGLGVWWAQGRDGRRRARALAKPPPLPLHRGDPLLGRLVAACGAQDLAALHGELSAMYGDWDRRSYYLRALLGELPRARLAVERWVASAPDDAFARLLEGLVYAGWAWEARGSGMADTVSDGGARLFRERLELAWQALEAAARLDPRDPHPLSTQIIVGVGLGRSDEVLEQLFQAAIARDRWHFDAHDRRVNSLKQKWSGQPHAALERARAIARDAPPGSDLPMLVVDALLEEWMAMKAARGEAVAKQLLLDPSRRAEARQAMERSILHPAHRDGHGWALLAVNLGAYLAWLQDDHSLLRSLLERLGDKAGVLGWYATPSHIPGFVAEARVRVGLL